MWYKVKFMIAVIALSLMDHQVHVSQFGDSLLSQNLEMHRQYYQNR